MNNQTDQILEAREERLNNVIHYLQEGGIVVIKANIPGSDKNLFHAFILTAIFKNELLRLIEVKKQLYFESADGPYYILVVNKDLNLKHILVNLEETHKLGRLIDLDFFMKAKKSVSRSELNLSRRRCYICNNDAVICSRSKKHSLRDLVKFMDDLVYEYLDQFIIRAIEESIIDELNLDYKFGLVSPLSNGSHPDMNYEMMKGSANAIIPNLRKMFWIGFNSKSLEEAYFLGKKEGLYAEEQMYLSTSGINTYKGLIFILGLTLLSCGYMLKNHQKYQDIFNNVATMTKTVFEEKKYNTFGEHAFNEYAFGGARSEASKGLPSVQKATEQLPITTDLHMTLIGIIANCEDTVMLKRAGSIKRYNYFKNEITDIKEYNLEKIISITNECIKNNISCGGAADILITTLFIKRIKENLM
jgi:holo-ACP synthase CitX